MEIRLLRAKRILVAQTSGQILYSISKPVNVPLRVVVYGSASMGLLDSLDRRGLGQRGWDDRAHGFLALFRGTWG